MRGIDFVEKYKSGAFCVVIAGVPFPLSLLNLTLLSADCCTARLPRHAQPPGQDPTPQLLSSASVVCDLAEHNPSFRRIRGR